jgi:sec-independent protein translocase protein TatB
MFPLEQGAFEMLLIGAIALIVVGPKDLPMLMRKVGQFTAKMRGLAAEFRASFDEMARQSELDELRKEVEALRTGQYVAPVTAEIDQHLSDFNPYPSGYPSPAPEAADSLLSPRETGGGDQAQHGEGGERATPPPPPGSSPGSSVPLPRDAGEEKIKKTRGKKVGAVDAAATPKPAKPRAPRKPKAAPAAREVEG